MNRPDLIYTEYQDAESFLAPTRAALERHESVNGLMLGLGLRLIHEPNAYGSQPYFATVGSAAGLQIAALMTPPHKLLLYAEEDRERPGVRLIADALPRGGWPVPGVLAREAAAEAFAATWRSQTGVDYRTGMRQRIYELRQVLHPRYPAGEFRLADLGDIELVRQWACGFYDDCFGGGHHEQIMRSAEEKVKNGTLYVWVDGVPTSMAARTRPTPHGEAVGFVYTPPSQRRKGYASAVVARLSQQILDDGKEFCTLYTDLANPTSNRIYKQIGYTAVADVIDIDFEQRSQP